MILPKSWRAVFTSPTPLSSTWHNSGLLTWSCNSISFKTDALPRTTAVVCFQLRNKVSYARGVLQYLLHSSTVYLLFFSSTFLVFECTADFHGFMSAAASGCIEEGVAGKMLQFHPLVGDWGNPGAPVPLQQPTKFLLGAGEKILFRYFGFRTKKVKNINN